MIVHCRLNGNLENLMTARLHGSAPVKENERLKLVFIGEKITCSIQKPVVDTMGCGRMALPG